MTFPNGGDTAEMIQIVVDESRSELFCNLPLGAIHSFPDPSSSLASIKWVKISQSKSVPLCFCQDDESYWENYVVRIDKNSSVYRYKKVPEGIDK